MFKLGFIRPISLWMSLHIAKPMKNVKEWGGSQKENIHLSLITVLETLYCWWINFMQVFPIATST